MYACDYLENGVVDEFYLFADQMTRKGYPCVVADVRELVYDGEVLKDKNGNRIDAIWRRCVTNDVIEHWDRSQQLISAVREQKVALIGSFAGHVVHDKQIFSALYDWIFSIVNPFCRNVWPIIFCVFLLCTVNTDAEPVDTVLIGVKLCKADTIGGRILLCIPIDGNGRITVIWVPNCPEIASVRERDRKGGILF